MPQTSPITPKPQSKKTGKGFILGAIGCIVAACVTLVVLLLGGAAVYWFFLRTPEPTTLYGEEDTPIENITTDVYTVEERAPAEGPDDYNWVSQRRLGYDDVATRPKDELRLMRNAIYARHGYTFRSKDLSDYFSQFDWYHPTTTVVPEQQLSDIERDNIVLIKQYE